VVAGGANSPEITVVGRQVTVRVFWQMPGADSPQREFSVVAQLNDTGP
jgi:hypothetical protein